MSLLTIAADVPNLDRVLQSVEKAQKGELPNTREAVRSALTDVVQRTWIQYASGTQVTYSGGTFHVNVVTGDYLRSIQEGFRMLESLTGEIFSNSSHGEAVEKGFPPFDEKVGLLNSPKAKIGKNGKRYITVPFRHGVPGSATMQSMPKHVYEQAKQLSYSRRNNFLMRVLTGKKYSWGGRLPASNEGRRTYTEARPQAAGYRWSTGKYSGMVKMGKPGQTQYLTFRRVSDNSDPRSWQHPGVKPRPIREAVVENTQKEVLQLIRTGFEMDLYFMGLGGGKP